MNDYFSITILVVCWLCSVCLLIGHLRSERDRRRRYAEMDKRAESFFEREPKQTETAGPDDQWPTSIN